MAIVDEFSEKSPIYEMDVLRNDGTTLLLTSCKDQPVHLRKLDNLTGRTELLSNQLLCLNHVQEVISPIALKAIGPELVMTGHMKGLLRLFDVNRPACEMQSYELKHLGRRQKKPISSICQMAGLHEKFIAVGCHSGDQVYLLDQRSLTKSATHAVQLDVTTGVSCMRSMGNLLFVGCRKKDNIAVYDLRYLSRALLQINFARSSSDQQAFYGNQRYYFDVHAGTNSLIAANPQGHVISYNLSAENSCTNLFAAHFEPIAALSVEPSTQCLATGAGKRRFGLESSQGAEDSDSSDSCSHDQIVARNEQESDTTSQGTRIWTQFNL